MFICREHKHAYRIRPSTGDGGIDVCVPISPGHVEIYQVKRFAENLTSSQKSQIKKSHKRIQKYAEKRGWTIDRWYLTLPLDRTPENDEWLGAVETLGTFPCGWVGLSTVEGWVSEYGDVVDYYLHDWHDRLMTEVAQFAQLAGIQMTGTAEQNALNYAHLTPGDVQPKLATLRETLNRRDPHFTYDFAVTAQPAQPTVDYDRDPLPAAITTRQFGDSYVTFWVYPRGAESLQERPVTVRATIVTAAGSPEHQEMEYFVKYGRTPTRPLTIEHVSASLPGGLSDEIDSGQMRMAPTPSANRGSFDRRLRVLSPDGDILAELDVTMQPPVSNHDGTGISNRGTDKAGLFDIEFLTSGSDATILLHKKDVEGYYPDQVEPVLAFIHHFTSPNILRISRRRGLEQAADQPIPEANRDEIYFNRNFTELRYARSLITMQPYLGDELKMPDLSAEPEENILQVLRAARLLNGETVELNWGQIPFHPHSEDTIPEAGQAFSVVFDQDLRVTIAAKSYHLGSTTVVAEATQLGTCERQPDGTFNATLVPAQGKDTVQLMWRGEASIRTADEYPPPR